MITRRLTPLPFLAFLLALLLIACGSSDDAPEPTVQPPAAPPSPTAQAFNGGLSSELQLTGLLAKPGTLKLADLKFLTKSTVTTNPQAGSGQLGEHSYSGPLLFDLVMAAEPRQDANVRNDLLRRAVVVTGSDGYKTAIAWGEIDPRFAAKKVMIAYERDGVALPEADGFARLIVPGDVFAGRYTSNVVRIEVKDSLPLQPSAQRKATTAFNVTGLVTTPGEVNLARLDGLKQSSVIVESNGVKVTYSGVLLSDLLTAVALKLDANKKNDILTKGIVGIGADGYASVVVGGEVDAKFGNVQVLIATAKDGEPLSDTDGFARIVVPGDVAAGRYVSNLMRLEVVEL